MRTLGEYVGASYDLEGDLIISFAIENEKEILEKLERLKDHELTIEAKKYHTKRSLSANAYFWKLCDLIAKELGTDKDAVYLLELSKYGKFDYIEVIEPAVKYIEPLYRLVEVDHYFNKTMYDEAGNDYIAKMATLKCYIGSSQYNKKEMAVLIDGTVSEANDLGIDTWTQAEIDNLISNWEGHEDIQYKK